MTRSTCSVSSRKRRRKILKQAKGNWGKRKNVYTIAKNTIEKGLQYQYRDRRTKKRLFRKLWIIRINAAAREYGMGYSALIHAMDVKKIRINRKQLSNMAIFDPEGFKSVIDQAAVID